MAQGNQTPEQIERAKRIRQYIDELESGAEPTSKEPKSLREEIEQRRRELENLKTERPN